jgi:hypothetical protein
MTKGKLFHPAQPGPTNREVKCATRKEPFEVVIFVGDINATSDDAVK